MGDRMEYGRPIKQTNKRVQRLYALKRRHPHLRSQHLLSKRWLPPWLVGAVWEFQDKDWKVQAWLIHWLKYCSVAYVYTKWDHSKSWIQSRLESVEFFRFSEDAPCVKIALLLLPTPHPRELGWCWSRMKVRCELMKILPKWDNLLSLGGTLIRAISW